MVSINRDANADNRSVSTCLGFSRSLPHQFDALSERTVGTANEGDIALLGSILRGALELPTGEIQFHLHVEGVSRG